MQLDDQRASGNVEDRRGMGMVGGGLGIGGVVIAVIAYFLGFDPGTPRIQPRKYFPMLDAPRWSGLFDAVHSLRAATRPSAFTYTR